jgi:hypothetical protein
VDVPGIESRLAEIFNEFLNLIPAEQIAEMLALVRAGEPGVALENFCTQLVEYSVAVPAVTRGGARSPWARNVYPTEVLAAASPADRRLSCRRTSGWLV